MIADYDERTYDRAGDQLTNDLARHPVAVYDIACLPHLGTLSHGLRAGDTSVLASFPKHGKSALAESFALDLSLEHGVLFLALELGVETTRLRMAAKVQRCSTEAIEKSGLDDSTRGEMNMRKLFLRAPVVGKKWNIRQIAGLIEKAGCPIVVLDHLRWIDGWLEGGMAPTKIAEQIRSVAAATGVHIIQCAQIRPQDYALKPSRWQIQDTTAVSQLTSLEILINRPYYGLGRNRDNIVELIARSNRWGPSGRVHARWIGETQTMSHLSDEDFAHSFDCPCKESRAKKGH